MKSIENLDVTVTYRVILSDIDVPDIVFRGLNKIAEMSSISDSEASLSRDKDVIGAFDWLGSNIRDGDAIDWSYEVDID